MFHNIQQATSFIQSRTTLVPEYGIILGTGLGQLAQEIQVAVSLYYEDIPHFPLSTVEGHSGKLLLGTLGGRNVVAMQGRFHYYEGYSMAQITFPVRVMKLLGIRKLLVTNAAGGLNPDFALSDLMVIRDHINLQPENPLTGKNMDELGVRFPDMSEPYDARMIQAAERIATQHRLKLQSGVYASVSGPSLETPAEYRYLRIIGADAVGMSTVPEIIVARHMELPCFAVSVITDLCAPGKIKKVTIAEVIAAARQAEPALSLLITQLIAADMDAKETDVKQTLETAAEGLLMPSESDYPFEFIEWKHADVADLTEKQVLEYTRKSDGTPVEKQTLKKFFKNVTEIKDWYGDEEKATAERFATLSETINGQLKNVRVYRVGETEIDVFIIGKTPEGNWAGLTTKVIET